MPAISWCCLVVAALAVIVAILGRLAVNAEGGGGRDLGLALFFAFTSAATLIGTAWAVPVLALSGGLALMLDRRSGWRLLAAAAVCVLPLTVYSWMG